MKKSYIIGSILWIIICLLLSIALQYILVKTTGSGHYHWGSSISVWFGGPILGIQAAVAFLVVDYFVLKNKVKDNSVLQIARLLVVITITVIIAYIQKKYF